MNKLDMLKMILDREMNDMTNSYWTRKPELVSFGQLPTKVQKFLNNDGEKYIDEDTLVIIFQFKYPALIDFKYRFDNQFETYEFYSAKMCTCDAFNYSRTCPVKIEYKDFVHYPNTNVWMQLIDPEKYIED